MMRKFARCLTALVGDHGHENHEMVDLFGKLACSSRRLRLCMHICTLQRRGKSGNA